MNRSDLLWTLGGAGALAIVSYWRQRAAGNPGALQGAALEAARAAMASASPPMHPMMAAAMRQADAAVAEAQARLEYQARAGRHRWHRTRQQVEQDLRRQDQQHHRFEAAREIKDAEFTIIEDPPAAPPR